MSNLINQASRLIFNSFVREGKGLNTMFRTMDVNLIVMSRETALAVMKEDYEGRFFHRSLTRTEPDKIGPARVAYDDSMSLGEMLVAEAHDGRAHGR